MFDWKLEDIWDPKKIFSGDNSPFIVKDGQLREFRPWKAIEFLQEKSNPNDERLIVLSGLTAWMVAPTGMIKTITPNLPKLTGQQFIHQAMVIRAAEELEQAFYCARRYQLMTKDPSTGMLFSQPLLLDASFDIFFALGGFEALLETMSVKEFSLALRNQSAPVDHVFEIISIILAEDALDPRKKLDRTNVEKSASSAIKQRDILEGKEKKDAGARSGPNTLKGHWNRLAVSTPLIYAAKFVRDGEFMRQVLRDEGLEPWENRHFDVTFRWVEPWLKRADDVATVLRRHNFLEAWPPKDAVFPLNT